MQNYKVMTIPHMRLLFEDVNDLTANADRQRTLSFVGGTMLLDGDPIHSYYGKGFYFWQTESETGCIWLRHFGWMGEGFVVQNGVRRSFKAVAETPYQLTYKRPDGCEIRLDLTVGVDFDPQGGSMTYCKLDYGKERIVDYESGMGEQKIIDTSITPQGCLHMKFDLSSYWGAAAAFLPEGFYALKLELTFDGTYSNATGTVLESKQNGGSGKTFALQGRVIDTDLLQALNQSRKLFRTSSQVNASLKECCIASGLTDAPCSIDELFCLPQPTSIIEGGKEITGQEQVQQKASETLYYLAVYHTAELSHKGVKYQDLFQVNKEFARSKVSEVSPQIFDLLSDTEVAKFLENYAIAVLGNAVSSATDQVIVDALATVSEPARRCRYYMSDAQHAQSMAKDAGFNKVMTFITKHVYIHLVPRFGKYCVNGPEWGQRLYDYSIKRLAMIKADALTSMSRVTHLTMMLGFLDDRKQAIAYLDGEEKKMAQLTYGSALYAKAFNMSLAELANSIHFDADGRSAFLEIMTAIFGILYDELQLEQSDKFSPKILEELRAELRSFETMTMQQFTNSCIEVADSTLNAVGHFYDIIGCISYISRQFADKPWLNYCGKMVAIGFYLYSMSACINLFLQWKDLTVMEKVESVSTCIVGVACLAETGVRWFALKTLLNPKASITAKVNAANILKFGGEDFDIIAGMGRVGGTELEQTISNAGRYVYGIREAGGAATDAAEMTRFSKIFRAAEVALRIINVVVLAFVIVTLGMDISDDFKFNRSAAIKSIDIINIAFTSVALVLEVASIGMSLCGTVCNAIPIIGAVCMIAGFIFSLVSMILKEKDKSDPPVIVFIKEVVVTFIAKLEAPPVSWQSAALV